MSVDNFGPFLIKYGRKQQIKTYGIIYTCLVTRSIHLDLATNLTTENFLLALRRFITIYGNPNAYEVTMDRIFEVQPGKLEK